MTNKCDCRPLFYCVASDTDECKFSNGQRFQNGSCIYIKDHAGMILCTNRDAQLSALIKRKGMMLK